jgi:hypothetical protein
MLLCLSMRQVSTYSDSDEKYMNFSLSFHEPCKYPYLKHCPSLYCKYLSYWPHLCYRNALTLYSIGIWFEPQVGYRLHWMRFFLVFLCVSKKRWEIRWNRSILLTYKLVIAFSFYSTAHNPADEITPVKKHKIRLINRYIYAIVIWNYRLVFVFFYTSQLITSWRWSQNSIPLKHTYKDCIWIWVNGVIM